MAQPHFDVDRTTALYERPAMNIVDQPTFAAIKQAVEACFAKPKVESFFKSLDRSRLRIRDFEKVLQAGKLGGTVATQYGTLSNGDQGQIRELYLALLERVDLALRDRFFKLYAYY